MVAEQLSEVAGIMDRAACDLYSLNSLPDELSEKICRQMKKNGAFVQKIWLQERPKEHLQIYMTVKAGRHCRITLRQTAELIGSLCGIPMVAVRDGAQVLTRRIPDGAVSGGCEIPGSLRCGTHHQGAGEYLRGTITVCSAKTASLSSACRTAWVPGSSDKEGARRWWSCLNSSCAPDSRGSWRHG